MGDRLTLETADERALWCSVFAVMADRCSPCAQAVKALYGRGPTEGASDAFECDGMSCPDCGGFTVFGYMLRNDAGKHMHTRYLCTRWQSGEDRCGWSGWVVPECSRGRPRTGEANPDTGDLRRAYREAVDEGATAERERDEALAKLDALRGELDRSHAARVRAGQDPRLGTLKGAVEDATGLLRDWAGVMGGRDPGASAALVAIAGRLDAARGVTPTKCECGPGARFDEAAQVCRECGRPLHDAPTATPSPTTQAPQVPDSPGWWLYSEEPKHVILGDCDLWAWCEYGRDAMTLVKVSQLNSAWWGGRCTRGAPDVDVEALRRLADSLDGPGTHSDAHAIRTALGDA